MFRICLLIFLFLFSTKYSVAQQVADTTYNPTISHPAYLKGNGPIVFIDEGHHNFHTREGRYTSFANLLERDGYIVRSYTGTFDLEKLSVGKILVISNALNEINVSDWFLPNPSAFDDAEIQVLRKWVSDGGSLFLIADHMPMAGAASKLAAEFGFEFSNGFVMYNGGNIPSFFSLKEGTLIESTITQGRDSAERVTQVATFTGQAFKVPDDANSILVFGDDHTNLLPDTAWRFNEATKRQSVKGWSQGAYMRLGKGRVAVFGEAAMFSAQLAGPHRTKMGMNSHLAPENYQLLLNIIHWLDEKF